MKEAGFPSPRAANHKELKQEIWNHETGEDKREKGKINKQLNMGEKKTKKTQC